MDITGWIFRAGSLIAISGFLYTAYQLNAVNFMMSGGASIEVSRTDPPLENPFDEAARQMAVYRLTTSRMNTCRTMHFDGTAEDRENVTSVYTPYMERNHSKVQRVMALQHEDIIRIQKEMQADLAATGDGVVGNVKKAAIVESRRGDITRSLLRAIHGGNVRILDDFPTEPTYNDCYKFLREVDYRRFDIKLPNGI